jgi:hypothetical protein
MPTFTVLCRIDAYADYVAQVEADSAEDAAQLARESHEDYKWAYDQTAEFDDRFYVTLDADDEPIEKTRVGDYI